MSIFSPGEGTVRGADRRRDARYGFGLTVVLLRGREEVHLATEDVSYGGLLLLTDEPPPLRYLLRLRLLIPPYHRELSVFGMPVHHAAGHGRRGAGVQLYALDHVARTVWGNFVTRVRAGELENRADSGIRLRPPESGGPRSR